MNNENNLFLEAERASACLAPHVRQACNSVPSPAVLATIHAAAERKARRNRILPFIRFSAAAAATLVVSLIGWSLIRSGVTSQAERQAALMDDMLFLCADEQITYDDLPRMKREELASRLLSLQGLN